MVHISTPLITSVNALVDFLGQQFAYIHTQSLFNGI